MQCPDFETRLHTLLDQRRDPRADEGLVAHAAWCDDCQSLLAGQVAILESLGRLKSSGCVLRRPISAAPRRRASRVRLALATAAAMLLALGIVMHTRNPQRSVGKVARDSGGMNLGQRAGAFALTTRGRPDSGEPPFGGQWLLEAPRIPEHFRTYRGKLGHLAYALPSALQHMDEYAPGFSNLRASFDMLWDLLRPVPRSAHGEADDGERERTGWRGDGRRVVV